MPNFSTTPPASDKEIGYRLVRTPPATPFKAHVISDRLIGCPTHFVGHRTLPCEAPKCEACDSGIGYRWHGYLLVLVNDTQEIVIFEMTRKASEAFTAYFQRHGTTRGCYFQATRLGQKHNGSVLIQTKTGDMTRVNLPPDKNLPRLLCHIWNIAPNQTAVTPPSQAVPSAAIHIHRDNPEITTRPTTPEELLAALADIQDKEEAEGNGKPKQLPASRKPSRLP